MANVIVFGYRRNGSTIESYHPNALHNYFMASIWTNILVNYGESVVYFLLLECSIFVKSNSNDCLIQICGPLLSETPITTVPGFNDSQNRRVLNRLSMLYGRPILPSHEQVCGLPSKRKFDSIFGISSTFLYLDPFNDLTKTKFDLAARIFFPEPHTHLPDAKIKKWQFKRLVDLSEEMRCNHLKCHYSALLEYYSNSSSDSQIETHRISAFLTAVLKRVLPSIMSKSKHFMNHVKTSILRYSNL